MGAVLKRYLACGREWWQAEKGQADGDGQRSVPRLSLRGWDSCGRPEGGTADTALESSHLLPPGQGEGKMQQRAGAGHRVRWKGSRG